VNLQRLLFNRVEHRIIVGTVAFLATLVLVGWIAINEGGRMAAFDKEFTARSIERGAALFVSNCAECHGVDGLGTVQTAPALNSPLLFGYDFLADIHKERSALQDELDLEGTTDARKAEINARLAELDQEETTRKQQMQPAIDKGYNPDNFSRILNVGWTSTLHNFVYSTAFSGRPVSSSYWPRPMPVWSQTAGGPLRNDQVEDIVQFVLNWDKGDNWTIEDLLAINQFPIEPSASGAAPLENAVGVDTSTADILTGLEGLTGDPQRGSQLYTSQLPCGGCHIAGLVAPPMTGTWTRIQDVRLQDPQFAGYTGDEYIAESIIHPSAYVVPTFADLMPKDFGTKLTFQDLADLIAYLKTQDQPAS